MSARTSAVVYITDELEGDQLGLLLPKLEPPPLIRPLPLYPEREYEGDEYGDEYDL